MAAERSGAFVEHMGLHLLAVNACAKSRDAGWAGRSVSATSAA